MYTVRVSVSDFGVPELWEPLEPQANRFGFIVAKHPRLNDLAMLAINYILRIFMLYRVFNRLSGNRRLKQPLEKKRSFMHIFPALNAFM